MSPGPPATPLAHPSCRLALHQAWRCKDVVAALCQDMLGKCRQTKIWAGKLGAASEDGLQQRSPRACGGVRQGMCRSRAPPRGPNVGPTAQVLSAVVGSLWQARGERS